MSATVIYLVRHGESELNAAGIKYGHLDPPLTPAGLAQADTTALDIGPVNQIITSPLRRAHDFANRLAVILNLPTPEVRHELTERNFGAAEGLTSEQIAARWPEGVIPGMESREHAAARARPILVGLDRVAVVTHAGVIRGLTGARVDNGEVVLWR